MSTVQLRTPRLLTLSIFGLVGCSESEVHPPDAPNVILIVADDLGYSDLDCYLEEDSRSLLGEIGTPNLDAMAREGMMFTDFYSAAPVCTAARAAILTGCYPVRIGLSNPDPERGEVLFPKSRVGLAPEEETMAEILKGRGYATACIGKWHLGRSDFLPTRQGFDEFYGPRVRSRKEDFAVVMRGETSAESVAHTDLTGNYTDEALNFIERNQDRRFFLYLAHSMPHTPLAASDAFVGTSDRGLYGDVVRELDWSTGAILRRLRELNLAETTLVIFTSDNGPAVHLGANGGRAFPLKAGKGRTDEGGVRVPCLMWWPGAIPEGVVNDALTSTLDLLPTVAELADAPLPEKKIDGVSLTPILFGDGSHESPRSNFLYYHLNNLEAVRQGPWKLVMYRGPPSNEEVGRMRAAALYDLSSDPGETRNLQLRHPEIVTRLKEIALSARRELGDDKTSVKGQERRPVGRLPGDSANRR